MGMFGRIKAGSLILALILLWFPYWNHMWMMGIASGIIGLNIIVDLFR